MRRAAKWIGGLVGGLVALPVLLLLFANTPPGRAAIAWLTPRVTGDSVRLDGLSGRFPDALRAASRRSITMRRCSNRSGDQSSTRSSTVA